MVGPQSLLHTRRGGIRQSKEELNHSAMRRILSRRDIDVPTEDYQFFAGTMFWVRRDALRLAEALALSEQDFPAEPAPGNGTTSHAMERLLGVSVRQAGMRLVGLPEIDAGGAKSGPRAHRPSSPDYLKTP
jgi:lipopolysaccharide biosynthesis protein